MQKKVVVPSSGEMWHKDNWMFEDVRCESLTVALMMYLLVLEQQKRSMDTSSFL